MNASPDINLFLQANYPSNIGLEHIIAISQQLRIWLKSSFICLSLGRNQMKYQEKPYPLFIILIMPH